MTVVAKAEMPDQDKTVKQLLHKIVSQNTEAQVWRQSIDRRVGVLEATLPERHNLIQQPKAVVKTKVVKPKKTKVVSPERQDYRNFKALAKASGWTQEFYHVLEAYKVTHNLSKKLQGEDYCIAYNKAFRAKYVA